MHYLNNEGWYRERSNFFIILKKGTRKIGSYSIPFTELQIEFTSSGDDSKLHRMASAPFGIGAQNQGPDSVVAV